MVSGNFHIGKSDHDVMETLEIAGGVLSAGAGATATCICTLAELLVALESPPPLLVTVNVSVVPCTFELGITGIESVSIHNGVIVVVLVQVTVVPT